MTESTPTLLEKLNQPKSLLAKALRSIESRNKANLVAELIEINQRLTGLNGAHFQTQEKLVNVLDEFINRLQKSDYEDVIIHLGDGYSRLAVGMGAEKKPYIYPTNNTRPEVVEKWKSIQEEYKSLDEVVTK